MKTKLIPGNGIFSKAAVKVDGTESSYTAPQSPVSTNFPRNEQWTANHTTDFYAQSMAINRTANTKQESERDIGNTLEEPRWLLSAISKLITWLEASVIFVLIYFLVLVLQYTFV